MLAHLKNYLQVLIGLTMVEQVKNNEENTKEAKEDQESIHKYCFETGRGTSDSCQFWRLGRAVGRAGGGLVCYYQFYHHLYPIPIYLLFYHL